VLRVLASSCVAGRDVASHISSSQVLLPRIRGPMHYAKGVRAAALLSTAALLLTTVTPHETESPCSRFAFDPTHYAQGVRATGIPSEALTALLQVTCYQSAHRLACMFACASPRLCFMVLRTQSQSAKYSPEFQCSWPNEREPRSNGRPPKKQTASKPCDSVGKTSAQL